MEIALGCVEKAAGVSLQRPASLPRMRFKATPGVNQPAVLNLGSAVVGGDLGRVGASSESGPGWHNTLYWAVLSPQHFHHILSAAHLMEHQPCWARKALAGRPSYELNCWHFIRSIASDQALVFCRDL